MINPTASAVLTFGILGMLVFEGCFIAWIILSNHKWRKTQNEMDSRN